MTHPHLTSCVEADGKVVSAISRWRSDDLVVDRETGEILRRRRHDPDVGTHKQGGRKELVRGHRHVLVSARGDGWFQRAILGVERAPTGSELDALLPMITQLNTRLDIATLLYDGAVHGTHIDELLTTHGIVCIAPVTAKKVDKDDHHRRVEREVRLPVEDAVLAGGVTRTVEVWAVGGAACEAVVNEAGDCVYQPLKLRRLERRGGPGAYRLYGQFVAADGAELRLSLYTTKDDIIGGFNRTEHLRPFPPGSPDYVNLYPRRSDTESLHRQLEDASWQKRANCYGRLRVHADVLGFAIGQNAIARHIHREDVGSAPPLDIAA